MHTFRTPGRPRTSVLVALALATAMLTPAVPAAAATSAAPKITSLSPTHGVVSGGTVVTIRGSGFTKVTAVSFGSTPATRFTVVSGSKLTATSPALGAGKYNLTVTTSSGTATRGTFTVRTYTDEVVRLVNKARASKRKCGTKTYKAVKPVKSSAVLTRVAQAHSDDMAANNYFGHSSLNGDSPFDRMRAAGYAYAAAGENIAAGNRTPASVVKAWLKSAGHCRNIMTKSFTEIGVGYGTGGSWGTYWTQDFGKPKKK